MLELTTISSTICLIEHRLSVEERELVVVARDSKRFASPVGMLSIACNDLQEAERRRAWTNAAVMLFRVYPFVGYLRQSNQVQAPHCTLVANVVFLLSQHDCHVFCWAHVESLDWLQYIYLETSNQPCWLGQMYYITV